MDIKVANVGNAELTPDKYLFSDMHGNSLSEGDILYLPLGGEELGIPGKAMVVFNAITKTDDNQLVIFHDGMYLTREYVEANCQLNSNVDALGYKQTMATEMGCRFLSEPVPTYVLAYDDDGYPYIWIRPVGWTGKLSKRWIVTNDPRGISYMDKENGAFNIVIFPDGTPNPTARYMNSFDSPEAAIAAYKFYYL